MSVEKSIAKTRQELGRSRYCGCGFLCFLLCIFLILVTAGGLIAFFLWVRVPEVKFTGVTTAENVTETFQIRGNTELVFNLRINITIDNPNYISVKFDEIKATAFHPAMPDVILGNGSIKDVNIMKKAVNVLLFPFSIHYNTTNDPQKLILQDLISRCGSNVAGQKKGSIDMDYEIDLNFSLLAFTGYVPKIRSKAGFDCPNDLNLAQLSSPTPTPIPTPTPAPASALQPNSSESGTLF